MFDLTLHEDSIELYHGLEKKDLLSLVLKSLFNKDLKSLYRLMEKIFEQDNIILNNPVTGGETFACFSRQYGLGNYIFFKGDKVEDNWIMVQNADFINLIITQKKALCPFNIKNYVHSKEVIKTAENLINNKNLIKEGFKRNGFFTGTLIDSPRPYHFFYDKFKHLANLKLTKKTKILKRSAFFPLESVVSNFITTDQQDDEIYVSIAAISSENLSKQNCEYSDSCSYFMEKKVREYSLEYFKNRGSLLPDKSNGEFIIWIGITGQKRSWLEQIEGYSRIINLIAIQRKVVLFIDGMTARDGEKIYVEEDLEVEQEIRHKINKKVEIKTLIGHDYKEKIHICNNCDAFIANGGTGGIVPLRFSKTPGVVHSNTKLMIFPDNYPDTIYFTNHKEVNDKTPNENTHPMNISYNLKWEVIYNNLARICHLETI